MREPEVKPLVWTGPSHEDLRDLPAPVQDKMGYALYQAQIGGKHRKAKPLSGLGPGVLEIVDDYDGDTYRAVYTVRFAEALYVLHVFQKKSRHGISTPQAEISTIRTRLQQAQQRHEASQRSEVGREQEQDDEQQ